MSSRAGKYKNKSIRDLLLWTAMAMLLCACSNHKEPRKVSRAFYYWKSVFQLSNAEKKLMDSLQVNTLYVKYFDVDWDNDLSQPAPKATLRIHDSSRLKQDVVPCIFITNACMAQTDSSQLKELAKYIANLIGQINDQLVIQNNEVQIDCDWTATTAEKYFSLLTHLKSALLKENSTRTSSISATIRLYQVKYLSKTGVPPVPKGLLMAYNMGNLRDPASENSILEVAELNKYINYLNDYPLPLDVALPIFEWTVVFRNKSFFGLAQQLPESVFSNAVSKKVGSNRFEILKDTLIGGYQLKQNDILRVETSDPKAILAAAKQIDDRLATRQLRLALFHIDSLTLRKYSFHELENFFSSLN